jgi:hypothetical protein
MSLRAKFLRVGPERNDGRPVLEIELADGQLVAVILDRAHGRSIAGRIEECVDGRILARPPSRRVLELELVVDAEQPVQLSTKESA